jgi:hypothetical protein
MQFLLQNLEQEIDLNTDLAGIPEMHGSKILSKKAVLVFAIACSHVSMKLSIVF